MDYQQQDSEINPLTPDALGRIEDAMHQLGPVCNLLQRCERCKIPVSAAREHCDSLTGFFQSILAEFKGPQAPIGGT